MPCLDGMGYGLPMLMDFHFPLDAADYLQAEYARRKARRPAYSLRAFARDLELSPSSLSEFMRGKCGISFERGLFLSRKLGLSPEQAEHFSDLVTIRAQSTGEAAASARKRIERRRSTSNVHVSLDRFKYISDWYYLVILELIDLHPRYQSPQELAKVLQLSDNETQEAIDRLLRLNMLKREEDGTLKTTTSQTVVGEDVASLAIQNFHRQILERATDALTNIPGEQRRFQSVVFSMNQKDLEAFYSELEKATMNLIDKYHRQAPKDRVYALTCQLFPFNEAPANETTDR